MEDIVIRGYRKEDRGALRDIACDTAFMGEPAEAFFDDREILADFLTLYFTDYEPESCFVAEAEGRIAGYIIGAKDTRILNRIFLFKILPRLMIKSVTRGTFLRIKNLFFLCYLIRSFIKGEFGMPDTHKLYPATLHINIETSFRNRKIGVELIRRYLNYLVRHKVEGIYLSTLSEKAAVFFERNGFCLFYKSKRSYFKNILNRDIWCYIYVKKIQAS